MRRANRIFHQGGQVPGEQDSIEAAVKWILRVHIDGREAGAFIERGQSDAGDAGGQRHAGQAGVFKRIIPDAREAVADDETGQAGAAVERFITDVGDAAGNREAGHGETGERAGPDAGDAVANDEAG